MEAAYRDQAPRPERDAPTRLTTQRHSEQREPGGAARPRARRKTSSGNWSEDAPQEAAAPASRTLVCPHSVWDKTRHQQDNRAAANAAARRQGLIVSRTPTDVPPPRPFQVGGNSSAW